MSTIDKTLFAQQMVVLDYLLAERDALPVLSFKAKGWPYCIVNVREAIEGLRNLGDEMQEQLNKDNVIVLEGV